MKKSKRIERYWANRCKRCSDTEGVANNKSTYYSEYYPVSNVVSQDILEHIVDMDVAQFNGVDVAIAWETVHDENCNCEKFYTNIFIGEVVIHLYGCYTMDQLDFFRGKKYGNEPKGSIGRAIISIDGNLCELSPTCNEPELKEAFIGFKKYKGDVKDSRGFNHVYQQRWFTV